MSTSIMKVFLLLAVAVCISQAQRKFLYFYAFILLLDNFHYLQREACSVDRQKDLFLQVKYVLVAVIFIT